MIGFTKDRLPYHPLLLAIYPVLFLYSANIYEVDLTSTIVPFLAIFTLTIILLLIAKSIIKDNLKAALIISSFLILFFSYGLIYQNLVKIWSENFISLNLFLMIVWLGILTFSWLIIARTKRSLTYLTQASNLTSLFLILLSLLNIGFINLDYLTKKPNLNNQSIKTSVKAQISDSSQLPDIYYLILDGYARQDILKDVYHYDNSEFIDYLKNKGFYVADQSHSNYAQTALSLSSSLNFHYLDELKGREDGNRQPLNDLIDQSELSQVLDQANYKTISFASGYQPTEIKNSDLYINPYWYGDEFSDLIINLTPLTDLFRNRQQQSNLLGVFDAYSRHINRINSSFEKIPTVAGQNQPNFVFSHIISPHPPFIFDRNGQIVNRKNRRYSMADGSQFLIDLDVSSSYYQEQYTEQLRYITKKAKITIDKLLAQKDRPKVIILQADHGPGSELDWLNPKKTNMKERLSILNAYYFSGQDYSSLYPTITPVNSFRLVLNKYFQTNLKLLLDESYFSTWKNPYEFINISDQL